MAQKLGVEVAADLDTSDVEKKINALGQKIAQANRTQFTPISVSSKKDLEDMLKMFEHLRVIQGDLNRRMKATGQENTPVLNADWDKLYVNPAVRARKMRDAFRYATGVDLGGGEGSGGGGGGGRQSPFPGMATGVVQSGLRATGPAGGVAANALGTGMSAGFGAGLMGLLGGMLALGVGKIVGSAMEKMEQAEDNAVALDRLKRVLGDVNIAFDGLKSVVDAGAYNLKITYAEAGRLATEFAKLGNLTADQHVQIAEELKTGVGFSRGFGLDPSQGVGFMGQMRGMRITTDAQESRKFALLIGETIGKSGAFAKADEVMEAIGNYATMQTRNSMGVANVGGFAGMYSSMVGSGIPGLDPAGAGSLLMRINSSLAAGGAKGEASQFFSNTVGQGMGLDAYRTQILREGGAFATKDEAFGEGSVYASYMGSAGASGSSTWMEESIAKLRRQYGNDPMALAQATANHFGIGMRQAMAILKIKPNEMGALQSYAGDVTKLSGSGIANLTKVVTGSASDRAGVAQSFLGRDDVSAGDKERLRNVMENGSEERQKQVLAELIASKDQERTQGSDIRDSKNALDNIKTSLADKLIPITLEMRHGIMAIAGVGKSGVTSDDIMKKVLGAESEGRVRSIRGEHDPIVDKLTTEHAQAAAQLKNAAFHHGSQSEEVKAAREKLKEVEGRLVKAVDKRAELLDQEQERLKASMKAMEDEAKARREHEAELVKAKQALEEERMRRIKEGSSTNVLGSDAEGSPGRAPYSERWTGDRSGGGERGDTASAMKYFVDQGWTKEQAAGIVANLQAESNLRHGAVGDGGLAYGVAQWHPDRQANFKRWAGKDIRESTLQEQLAFVHYELTEGEEQRAGRRLRGASTAEEAGSIVSTDYERPKHRNLEARKRAGMAGRIAGTPLPDDAAAREAQQPEVRVRVEGGEFTLRDQQGTPRADPVPMSTRVYQPMPFGTGHA